MNIGKIHRGIYIFLGLALLVFVYACTHVTPVPPKEATAPLITPGACGNTPPWVNQAVFYEIFVRSYKDANGDGMGDFDGLVSKLDYLNDGDPTTTTDLGVTALWLMPIFPCLSYHGYDVRDYRHVNSYLGGDDAFIRFLKEAHKRGIRVIIDLVLNHTSDDHPWFQRAAKDINSREGKWYIWSPTLPQGWGFPWGGGSSTNVWHSYMGDANKYYYGAFGSGMPDLNLSNPDVKEELFAIAREWLRKGVDGFRLDAIRYFIEKDSQNVADIQETHEFLKELYAVCRKEKADSYLVGEAWTDTDIVMNYYDKGCELDSCFDFQRAGLINKSAVGGNSNQLVTYLTALQDEPAPQHFWGQFLSNHDQERVATSVHLNEGKMRTAAAMLMTLPGVPFMYYGEEIGTAGEKPDPELRKPMAWDDSPNAGFTTSRPWNTPPDDYKERNVKKQSEDPNSLLNWYKQLIRLRNQNACLGAGAFKNLGANPFLLTFGRYLPNELVVVMVNLTSQTFNTPSISFNNLSVAFDQFKEIPGKDLISGADLLFKFDSEKQKWQSEIPLQGYACQIVKITLPKEITL